MPWTYNVWRALAALLLGMLVLHGVDSKPWARVACEPIRIAVAAKNLVKANYRLAHFAHMFDSVLRYATHPLHWLILIPTNEVQVVNGLLERIKSSRASIPVFVSRENF